MSIFVRNIGVFFLHLYCIVMRAGQESNLNYTWATTTRINQLCYQSILRYSGTTVTHTVYVSFVGTLPRDLRALDEYKLPHIGMQPDL